MACQVYYFMYQKGVLCFPSQIRKNCDPENPKIFFFGDLKFSKIYLCCHIHFCNLFFSVLIKLAEIFMVSDVSPSFQFSKCGLFSSVFVASLCQTTYKREDFDSTTMHPPWWR